MFNSVIQNKPAKCYITVMHYFPILRDLDNMLIFFPFPKPSDSSLCLSRLLSCSEF
jgi:hypothetical protein